jgi:hypothetical protein
MRFILAAAVALLVAPGAPALTTYSAFDDFSTTTNTEGSRWSYRWSADALHDGSYALLSSFGQPFPPWSPPHSTWYNGSTLSPGVGRNDTGGLILGNPGGSRQFAWLNGEMWLHPANFGLVVVSWLVPFDSSYDVLFLFADMDGSPASATHPASNGIIWSVDLDTTTLASGVLPNNATGPLQILSDVPLVAGDRIHFIVDANGDYRFDSTRFLTTILTEADVPEPAGLAVAALASVVVSRLRRRR